MPTIKEELFNYLTSPPRLTQANIVERLYPDFAPTGVEYPYIIYSQEGNSNVLHLTGVNQLCKENFEFEVYAKAPESSYDVQQDLRRDLDGFIGDMGSISVRRILLNNIIDNVINPTDATQVPMFYTSIDFDIWYIRT